MKRSNHLYVAPSPILVHANCLLAFHMAICGWENGSNAVNLAISARAAEKPKELIVVKKCRGGKLGVCQGWFVGHLPTEEWMQN